jgi:hypothetical protein
MQKRKEISVRGAQLILTVSANIRGVLAVIALKELASWGGEKRWTNFC